MAETTAGERHLVFRVGATALAVALPSVVRVLRPLPVTRVPHAPACLLGVINLEHDIIPVLSLDCALGLAPEAGDSPAERVILVEVAGESLGLRVDAVNAIHALPAEACVPAPAGFAGIDGALLHGLWAAPEEPVAILNVPEVFARAFARPPETG